MSAPQSVELIKIVNALKSLRTNINVPTRFHDRMDRINVLLNNDKTGIVSTVIDFMIHTANTPMKIETQNANLDKNLSVWQKTILNKNINIDVPRGLRELSTEYFKERWKSSFLALNVRWNSVEFTDGSTFEVPTRMWFADGSALDVTGDPNGLNTKRYFIGKRKSNQKELKNSTNGSVYIRKPFNSLYESFPTPFLVRRGVLFNALLKEAIITKQADVIEAVIPYLLLLRAGTDKLAELEMLADEEEMKRLKDSIIKAKEEHDVTGDLGKLIASLNYDVNVEHLMPDLNKIFNGSITQATDKNLLAGLGLIELEGFAKNRQETILNPKVLVEEIKDAVNDWAALLEEVMYEMMERNKRNHPKLYNNEIRVVPGTIKAFVTDDMRSMLRSLYDRGLLSKQRAIEDLAEMDFNVEIERRDKEERNNLQYRMRPPLIQNLEQYTDPELEDQDKLPSTPESDNFNNAVINSIKEINKKDTKTIQEIPYETIDDLPRDLKKSLPVPAQVLFLTKYNTVLDKTNNTVEAEEKAWDAVKEKYRKPKDNKQKKWVKK